jgi:hypothetical protein
LGITTEEIQGYKPESDIFFKTIWMKIGANNSAIYWECFRSLPNNAVSSYLDMSNESYIKWKQGKIN